MSSSMQQRRQLVKVTKQYGLHVQPAALQLMIQYVNENMGSLTPLMECLQEKLARTNPKIITPQLWEESVQDVTTTSTTKSTAVAASTANVLEKSVAANAKSTTAAKKMTVMPRPKSKQGDWLVVVAFATPTLLFDSLRQQFHYAKSDVRPSLFGTVDDKIEMMAQRFLRVQQRVARSVSFLTSIDRLLGSNATATQILLGLLHATSSTLSPTDEGVKSTGFELEDLTGSIPLQLHSSTFLDSNAVYTEGCIVLVEGYYDNGIFVVNELKLPPIEPRAKTQLFLPPPPIGFTTAHAVHALPLTLYTMSNVALDDPLVLQALEELVTSLRSQEADGADNSVVVVLMGNFTTPSLTLSLAMEELSRILEPLPSHHSVLILPGPNDTPSMCWPIPPIKAPPSFANHLQATVQFVSNPCRLLYGDQQEILLYRQDMIRQHLQHEILSVRHGSKHPLTDRIFHSILAQGHLLPQAPIYWNYDYAMGVYPLPELLLLGLEEGEEKQTLYGKADCNVVTPGCHGKWAKVTLYPQHKRRGGLRRPLHVEFSQTDGNETDNDSIENDSMDED